MDGLTATFRRLLSGTPAPPQDAFALSTGQQLFFAENGYLILPRLFSGAQVTALRASLDHLWAHREGQGAMAIDSYVSLPTARRIAFRKAPGEVRGFPYKILDPHLENETIRDACASPPLLAAIGALLGATPLVCNTLLFERGSEQDAHFDTFFMPSKTPNMMAASWIALDPVTHENGPLYYYPKSHLIPPFRFSHGKINAIISELATDAAAHIETIIRAHGLRREIFLPQPGDVLIWHAQLLHGGSRITNPAQTRRSLVTHYWTEVDFPNPADRIDLGDRRWLLRKHHEYVIDDEIIAEIDAFLATAACPADLTAEIPPAFDARRYLAKNQDVLRAGVNPWQHYARHGRQEGRLW